MPYNGDTKEMGDHISECLGNTHSFDEEFLRDILQQPEETTAPVAAPVLTPIATATSTATVTSTASKIFGQNVMIKNNSSIISQYAAQNPTTSSPTTYILSFDKATALLPTGVHDPCSVWKEVSKSQLGSNHATESLPLFSSKASQVTKKTRSASKTLDHIMSERNRRQELTKKFIALSATIPDLKKMEKAHVLREAINYVKQLQERVKELEEDVQKNGVDQSLITITRSHLCIDDGTAFCETNTNECYGDNEALPDVEARVLGKDVLIKIHCGKQKGILVKILSQLERLHLSISSSNVLPFGNTLDITIIALMDDKYNLIVKDLVKNLRLVAMLKSCDVQQ